MVFAIPDGTADLPARWRSAATGEVAAYVCSGLVQRTANATGGIGTATQGQRSENGARLTEGAQLRGHIHKHRIRVVGERL